jgi:hypothetical protein
MTRKATCWLALCLLLCSGVCAAEDQEFSFGVIANVLKGRGDDPALREAIEMTDADSLAFVVANGVKAGNEPCTDAVYKRRKALLEESKNGLIVSLTASDWAECRNAGGKSSAVIKLNFLRDLFFADEFSAGATKIPLVRQSTIAKFRDFSENARWEVGDIMFATLNLPRNNNHYVIDAGRNSEFEDRLVANRDWIHRIFSYATRRRLDGIVLFSDGNPLAPPVSKAVKRDGYMETRKLIQSLSEKFAGRVLLIHGQAAGQSAQGPGAIRWQGNLGELSVTSGWIKLTVGQSGSEVFTVDAAPRRSPVSLSSETR